MNDLPQRQKFSGAAADRRRRARHQPESAGPGVPREAHRRRPLPRVREHAQPGLQAAAAAEVEEGSDRPDDGAAEPDQAADPDPRLEGDVRVRQGRVQDVVSAIRIGTSGWSYPSGKGTWNGIFYPAQPRGARARQVRRARVLRRALRHRRDQLDVLRRAGGRRRRSGWAERTPRGLRVLAQALSEVHAPGDVPQGDRAGSARTSARRTSTSSARAIDPLASAGKLGALLAQFPASFKNEPDTRGYLEWLLEQFKDYDVAVELRHAAGATTRSPTLDAARDVRRRVDADRRAEVQDLDPAGPAAQRAVVLLPAAARPQRRAVVEAREVRGPLQLPVFGRRARAVRRGRRARRRAR